MDKKGMGGEREVETARTTATANCGFCLQAIKSLWKIRIAELEQENKRLLDENIKLKEEATLYIKREEATLYIKRD